MTQITNFTPRAYVLPLLGN